MKVNVLCIGDVVGRPGRRVLAQKLHGLVQELDIDCVIANAENAAGGSGITPQIYDKLCKYGVNVITLGDHCYRKRDIIPTLETQKNIIRPANLSANSAGKDAAIYQTSKGATVGVVTLIGRIYMKPADCPYAKIDALLPRLRNEADILFVEVHAEATSEKVAMSYYLDGKVSCVFGTHTHVMTADERILAKGTASITDIGMTGAHDSVLGRNAESVVKAFRTQMPFPFDIAANDVRINAILVTVDSHSKKAEQIRRLVIAEDGQGDTLAYDSDDGRPDICNGF
jgi:metallophosphoesterase (TIGR00282 family)